MKRLLIFALCAIGGLSVFADQAVVGKRTWSFDANPDGKTCTVRGVFPANGSISVPAKLGGLTVTRVDSDTFDNPTVTALSIPAGVKEFDDGTFWNCFTSTNLVTLKVAAGNKTFSAADGVLYDKKKTKVLAVLPTKKGTFKVPASVRTIGVQAFSQSSLTSVVLPKKLKTIEEEALNGAGSVGKLTIPASVTTLGDKPFSPRTTVLVAKKNKNFAVAGNVLFDKKKTTLLHCPATKKGTYKIPASVTAIAPRAFEDCGGLAKITIGKKVKTIGYNAFERCTGLQSVSVPSSVAKIESGAFYDCTKLASVTIANGVQHIGSSAFEDCTALKSLTIPASVRTIGYLGTGGYSSYGNPFGCSGVKTVKVASGNKSFAVAGGCLVSKDKKTLVAVPPAKKGALKIPASVASIESDALDGCGKLTSISIPAGVDWLQAYNLGKCYVWNAKTKTASSSLRSFSVASGNPSYTAVGGVLFSKDKKTLVAYPIGKKGAYTVPSSATEIGNDAFAGAVSVTKITVPDSVKSIGGYAFADCPELASVRLPSKLDAIPVELFSCDTALKSIAIPSTVTSIGNWAFWGCSGLKSVSIPSKVASIGSGAFGLCPKLSSITVPASVKTVGENAFGAYDRQSGPKKLSLPGKGTCDVPRQRLPASCKVVYRNKTPVYWIRLHSNGGYLSDWEVPYESAYDAKGNWTGYAVSSPAYRGKATALPACPFGADTGRIFAGWALSPTGAVKYKDKAAVKNLAAAGRTATLYAAWKTVKTTYVFKANGGSGSMPSVDVDYDTGSAEAPACAFTRPGWTFGHWNTEPDDSGDWYWGGSSLYCDDSEKDATVTLYAIWEENYDGWPTANRTASRTGPARPQPPVFVSAGDVPWVSAAFGGEPCRESGAVGNGGTSSLAATVEGSGVLAFRWRTSSEAGRDVVFFSVDGEDVSSRSGLDEDWTSVSVRVEGDGPHVLRWTYAKNASGSAGDDRARLADVIWIAD